MMAESKGLARLPAIRIPVIIHPMVVTDVSHGRIEMIELLLNGASEQPVLAIDEAGRREQMLDEALDESYPASDPIGSLQFN